MNRELVKPFKVYGIIVMSTLAIMVLFFVNFQAHYDRNYFEITINNQKMHYVVDETFTSSLVLHSHVSEDYIYELDNIEKNISYILNIKEYEVYNGILRKQANNFDIDAGDELKEINANPYKLVIKNKDNVLYDGSFINDITKYLNNDGLYYIHIYNKRKDNFFSSVKTHFSFIVNVGENI
ncbi:MAG: hypothetical protein IJ572_01635 [Bacilli bacterium]|nr:hypothetical protein [Bacilli bacterium]